MDVADDGLKPTRSDSDDPDRDCACRGRGTTDSGHRSLTDGEPSRQRCATNTDSSSAAASADLMSVDLNSNDQALDASDSTPICVINQTIGGFVDFASLPGMDTNDDSETDGCHDGDAARGRDSANDSGHTSLPDGEPTSPAASLSSVDPKLMKLCLVTMDRCDIQRTEPVPVEPVSRRLAKLKSVKNIYSVDVLGTCAPAVAGGSARQLTAAAHIPAPVVSASRSRGISSLLTHDIGGRRVDQQDQAAAAVRPSDPLPPSLGVKLLRTVNSAWNRSMSQRTVYTGVGSSSCNMVWLSVVSCAFGTSSGGDTTFCQCAFCPVIADMPAKVGSHISADHEDLLFALNRWKPVVGPPLYIKCSHCNFVTIDSTLLYLHFETYHDILDCGTTLPPDPDTLRPSGPDVPASFVDVDEVMGPRTACVCLDCLAVSADRDAGTSARTIVRHVIREHPRSDCLTADNVKVLVLSRDNGDLDTITGTPTYRQAITGPEHAHGRRELFVCFICRHSSFSSYLALSHSIAAHQTNKLLYVCDTDDCRYQCLSEVDMMHHIKV